MSHTELKPVTLTQIARVVVPAHARPRKITVLTPAAPDVFALLDTTPEDIGGDNIYEMAQLPGDAVIPFTLQPGQTLLAAAKQSTAKITLIIEYL